MPITEYASYDGLGLAELVRRREVTPGELIAEAVRRIERHDPTLNAIVHSFYDRAREMASGIGSTGAPFAGVPFLLKDLLGDLKDVPTSYASRFMHGHKARFESELVTRFRRAGLVPMAKTNAPEFGLVGTTESALYGPCRNPWNPEHSTGGSSGGSAAAVAAGIVPLAHANDGGGSIRIPASCCGLVGLKPTRGRNPFGPLVGDALGGLVVEHVVSRTVRDSAVLLDCTSGPAPGDPYAAQPPERPYAEEIGRDPGTLRVAFAIGDSMGVKVDPECELAVREAARACEDLGHRVEEAYPLIGQETLRAAFTTVWAVGAAWEIDAFALLTGQTPGEALFEPLTWALYRRGKQVSAVEFQNAITTFQITGRQVGAFMTQHDVWICPTLAKPPVPLGTIDTSIGDVDLGFEPMLDYVAFTPLQNATGQPAISLPLHQSKSGLPVGVQFSARLGDEGTLLALAAQLEQARPWIDRKPPIWD